MCGEKRIGGIKTSGEDVTAHAVEQVSPVAVSRYITITFQVEETIFSIGKFPEETQRFGIEKFGI